MTRFLVPACLFLLAARATGQTPTYDTLRGPDDRILVLHTPASSQRASDLLDFFAGMAPLPGLPADTPGRAEIVLAPSEAAFQQAVGSRVPEWGAAVAIPSEDRIVLPGFGSGRGPWNDPRTLRHEWAHLGLHGYLDGLRVPRWMSEGYAEWASGGWAWSEGWRLRFALAAPGSSLDSLALSWPRGRTEARSAYLLAGSAVEYLAASTSDRGLEIFFDRWKETGRFEASFRETFGLTTGQFEEDWKKYVKSRYGWLFVLSHSAIFWLILTLGSVLLWRIRRHRNRLKMARLRAREIPELPAYWLMDGGSAMGSGGGAGTGLAAQDDRPAFPV